MLELVKKNIHMNRWKGYATSQITLDDDFIVPDSMDDVDQMILSSGEITIDSVKNQTERVVVREEGFRPFQEALTLRNPSMCPDWRKGISSSWHGSLRI